MQDRPYQGVDLVDGARMHELDANEPATDVTPDGRVLNAQDFEFFRDKVKDLLEVGLCEVRVVELHLVLDEDQLWLGRQARSHPLNDRWTTRLK